MAAGVALISQVGSYYGQQYLDALGGGIVASMLAHSACASLQDSLDDLLDADRAAASDLCGHEMFSPSITAVHGVRNFTLRARRVGPHCLADLTLLVDTHVSDAEAAKLAEAVHGRVLDDYRHILGSFATSVVRDVDLDQEAAEDGAQPSSGSGGTRRSASAASAGVEGKTAPSTSWANVASRPAFSQDCGTAASAAGGKSHGKWGFDYCPERRGSESADASGGSRATMTALHSGPGGLLSAGATAAANRLLGAGSTIPEPYVKHAAAERKLQKVTLLWERGPESRQARVPTLRLEQDFNWTDPRTWYPESH